MPPEQSSKSHPTSSEGSWAFSTSQKRSFSLGIVAAIPALIALASLAIHVTPDKDLAQRLYLVTLLRRDLILLSVAILGYSFEPLLTWAVGIAHRSWRPQYTPIALGAICVLLSACVVSFGRHQFGGYDFNIVIETGWREVQGQRPYVDFPTTTPPGFNLGIEYAYRLFGVNWNANLYLCAFFASTTFLWMYWLLVRLAVRPVAAAAVAFTTECAGVLVLSFWWYNNTALTLAAIFLLSCMLYARQPESSASRASFVTALLLLGSMKPNIAAATVVSGVVALLICSRKRLQLLLLTFCGTAWAVLVLLFNHVDIHAMLASYIGVSNEHGGLARHFGWDHLSPYDRWSTDLWTGFLSLPLLWLVPWIRSRVRERDWHAIACSLFFPIALGVTLYGLATNGEYRDVEYTLLLAAGGVLTFGLIRNREGLRRVYVAILCATVVGDLYYAALRIRVYTIGPEVYFQWQDNNHRIDAGYFKDMRIGPKFLEVEQEVRAAISANKGPYYFGQRLDFNYAALAIPSPKNLPAWWEPGTSFAAKDADQVLAIWKRKQFQTLIFLRKQDDHPDFDHTYYTDQFLQAIDSGYVMDDSFPLIVVYRRSAQTPN